MVSSAQAKNVAEADKEFETRMTRLQERLVSRDASARKYKVSKATLAYILTTSGCFNTFHIAEFADCIKMHLACDNMVCWQEAVKVLKTRILEALKVATMQQQECEQLHFQLAQSQREHEVVFPVLCVSVGFCPV